jgi:hypothetical protein
VAVSGIGRAVTVRKSDATPLPALRLASSRGRGLGRWIYVLAFFALIGFGYTLSLVFALAERLSGH